MRINKYIGESGYTSRREADKLIKEEKVTINGAIAMLGSVVSKNDVVKINGEIIEEKTKNIYIVLNKPVGITCTTERHIEDNIIDYIDHEERIFPVGRLDKDSQGLIILTSDGDIVNKILRSENNHEKEYIVTVNKKITEELIKGLANGVSILNQQTKKCKVSKINNRMFRIILTQGLNRQIRRMCDVFDYKITKLERIRIMNIELGELKLGSWRELTSNELNELKEFIRE